MVALSILALSLTAIFSINSSSVYGHVYAKKLTVATLLARSKMTDIEQELFDKGFQTDDDEQAGDFSDEGWPSYKWRAKVMAPKTNGMSPDQLIGAIFNLPMGGGSGGSLMDGIAGMFGGGKPPAGSAPSGPTPASSIAGAMGPAAGLMQGQFQQLVDQITKAVREVHLTVTWKEGKITESFDIVTHVVSLGPGSDRNGGAAAAALAQSGQNPNAAGAQFVRADNGSPVMNPVPCVSGSGQCDGDGVSVVIPIAQFQAQQGIAPNGGSVLPNASTNLNQMKTGLPQLGNFPGARLRRGENQFR
ncbi:MAG: hypothetical protein IPJ65_24185 [Archangiaceae bacterium]|nr:hypothetical protein [Archangiaceae bacterium]